MKDSVNLNDHVDHDPSACDFARMLLIQKFAAGTHVEAVDMLATDQILMIGLICALDSQNPLSSVHYATYDLTLEQVFNFSEYLRKLLIAKRGFLQNVLQGNPNLN